MQSRRRKHPSLESRAPQIHILCRISRSFIIQDLQNHEIYKWFSRIRVDHCQVMRRLRGIGCVSCYYCTTQSAITYHKPCNMVIFFAEADGFFHDCLIFSFSEFLLANIEVLSLDFLLSLYYCCIYKNVKRSFKNGKKEIRARTIRKRWTIWKTQGSRWIIRPVTSECGEKRSFFLVIRSYVSPTRVCSSSISTHTSATAQQWRWELRAPDQDIR